MEIIKKYKYPLALFLIAIIAFWQIVFFIHPVKYDMIDCYYPWRYFVGECLQHGKLPLWNPYQNLGYPIHADPSSGAWYPITWMIGYTSGYNIYSLGIEFILHVFFAGIGFYKLSKTLQLSNNTAFIAGVSYMLCGIFIGNAQHITYIISACWLPFVLNYYLKMTEQTGYINSIKAALFLFLMITGGYPAITIILFYLLLLFFIYYVIKQIIDKQKQVLILFIKQNLLFLISTILLSFVMLTAVFEVAPFITRLNQFTIQSALTGPFSPQSMISFILPFASIKNPEFFASDISMTSAYFGLILFMFFFYGLFIKKPFIYIILLGFSMFSLLASFGGYVPVREFLFDYVPMMNLFRFPSVFRLFVIIGFLLVGAYSFDKFLKTEFKKQKKTIIGLALFFIFLLISIILIARYHGFLGLGKFIKHDLLVYSKTSTLIQHIAFQSILQIGVLLAFILIVLRISEKNKIRKYITLLIIIDLLVCSQLNEPYTAYYDMFSVKKSNEHIKKFQKGFPQLKDVNISEVKSDELYFGPFWKNLNIFQKQISADGWNSFSFTGYNELMDSTQQLYSEITKNKIIFLSDKVFEDTQLNKFRRDSAFTNKTLFFKKKDFDHLKKLHFKTELGDTARLVYFAPDSFIVKTETQQAQLLTLLQNNYTGWEIYVNDKKETNYTSNQTLITAVIPRGKNKISFVYRNNKIKIAFYISSISLLLCLLVIIIDKRKEMFKDQHL